MLRSLLAPWRVLFLLAFVLMALGGPRHPRGSMAEMLAHPDWVMSHLLVLASYVALLGALFLLARARSFPARAERWLRFALGGTVLMIVEMALHTAAVMDHTALVAGDATPLLSIHLVLSIVLYPIFAVTMIGFLLASARDRALGSPWFVWLGIVGLAAHGAAPVLVIGLRIPGASILFPMVMFFGLWLALAAVWPVRRDASGEAPEATSRLSAA